jgi:uroporphyrinogen-III synthase/uroporphyrinogen III methyltransferase/synthase
MTALPLPGRRVLEGKRILVTRAAHQAGKLSEGLRALGAEPVEVPVLEIQPPENYEALDEALMHLDQFDWLILTSVNALHAIGGRGARLAVSPGRAEGLKVAAIGSATAEMARHYGFTVHVTPEAYNAERLAAALGGLVKGKRILVARAAVARDVIPDALRAAGATVDVVDAYRNVMPKDAPELLRAAFGKGIDAATFTSSSSVTHLAEAARAAGIAFPFSGVRAISIGPITSQTLHELGWEPAAEAVTSDIPGLVAAAERLLRR